MKVLASVVTVGFLVLGAVIPPMAKAETGITKPHPHKVVAVLKVTPPPTQEPQEEIPSEPVAAPTPAPAVHTNTYSGSGDASLDWIIARESGGNAYAVNPSSGACGVAQELPCGKSGCALGDGPCQINWMRQYCISRYGSTYNAMVFWQAHNWY